MSDTTTAAIFKKDNERLSKKSKQFAVSKKEAITIILDYLDRTGIDPRTDSLPKSELNQLKKRFDFVIGFLKSQEKEYIKPALEAIVANEDRMKNNIEQLATKDYLKNQLGFHAKLAEWIVSEMKKFVLKKEETLSFQKEIKERLERLENRKGFNW